MVNLSIKTIKGIIVSMRPVHWIKNFGIFAALIFSGLLFNKQALLRVTFVFFTFNLAASATYIINDLLDAEKDSLHPIKKNRPIASAQVSKSLALITATSLAGLSLILSSFISDLFFIILLSYLLMQAAYSIYLKTIPVLDILIIAAGFIIRIYSGALVVDAHLSVWFLLCVISTALFLASGKRRAEIGSVKELGSTRKSLKRYPVELLNSYVTMFGNAAWMSWALFTFFESPQASVPLWLMLAELSRATTINKLLMITIPITIFGIMRYESLIFEGRAEAPEKLLLADKALVFSFIVWVSMVVWILYGGVATSSPIGGTFGFNSTKAISL